LRTNMPLAITERAGPSHRSCRSSRTSLGISRGEKRRVVGAEERLPVSTYIPKNP